MAQSRIHLTRRGFVGGTAAAASALALGVHRVPRALGQDLGPIKIVSPLPLSGPLASDGIEMQRGLQLAVEEANAAGIAGGQIELVTIDSEDMSAEKVVTTFQRAIDEEEADAIIIGYAAGTGPEYEIVAEAGVPYIHFNTYEATAKVVREDPEKYSMIFQGDPTEVWYGRGLPVFMQGLIDSEQWTPANNKVAIVTSDNGYSVSIANLFREGVEAMGWEVAVFEQVITPVSEWGPTLAKIRDAQPAFICNTDYNPADLATFTKGFIADPSPALLYEQYGPSIPEFLELAGEDANGVIWSTVIGVLPDEAGNAFRERYEAKFGEAPGFSNAGSCYDAVMFYLEAVVKAGDPKDYAAVSDAIRAMNYRGVCGTYVIDPADNTAVPYPDATDDPEKGLPHLYFQIQDGKQMVIGPDPFVQSEFQLPPWLA